MENPIASKKRTRQIQESWNASTKKSFGQNFIVEAGVVDKIAKAAVLNPDGVVIEIGPGIGALTQFLCEYAKRVIAFEIDPRFPPILEKEIASDHLEIVQQDFLDVDVDALLEPFAKTNTPVYFASNLPYYITTPILFKLFEANEPIAAITVMMQKEVADRFMAKVGSKEYNALSVITQYRCHLKRIMDVNRNVFWPSPNVGSTVLQFTFRQDQPKINESQFVALVKACFVQRRKTLLNNLQTWLDGKEKALALLAQAGIEPATRAQQLEVRDFLRLYESYTKLNLDKEDEDEN
ncbi:16S rRNA (adenine(1518)-N(6)/adenine(1519)-N(6))-dimethyltransferase RsmA [Erysipelotrichaceae bacterium RD49]|nr:16S rRNA (adenine(1518)-N(6)/adenine(1519)-N(6))-dimethyltransferase RsmA [Erysipelotrichaceae bacterium RD49]